jgi:hypothetical protein
VKSIHIALAAALAAPLAAHAGDVFYVPNQVNGAIVLTDSTGGCPTGSNYYYTTDARGQASPGGCWIYSDPWVYARDTAGQPHQWMLEQFIVTEYAKTHYAPKQ